MSDMLIRSEPMIGLQRTIVDMMKGYVERDPVSPMLQAILLQKIHEDCLSNPVQEEDGFQWAEYSHNDLSEWLTYHVLSIQKQLKYLHKNGYIKMKVSEAEAKKPMHKRKVEYRVNYDKLVYEIKKYEDRVACPTYKGLNKHSWGRFIKKQKEARENGSK